MKYIKKISNILLIIVMLSVTLFVPSNRVEAKTLRDLKEELYRKENEYEASRDKQRMTESEINDKKASISAINDEISNINQEMLDLTAEIEKLTEEIKIKEKQIKEILNYYQLSNGESAYLEYVFNAVSFTDFIYRLAIAEQLSNYNDKLIDEYNATIKKNEEKKIELSNKTVALQKKQEELAKELVKLQDQLSDVLEETVSIEDEIEALRDYVDTYENKYQCGLDEDISVCGRDKLPPGTKFYRPVVSGVISANFGWYYPWGYAQWHYGMDFAGTGHGANVYAVADGKVATIMYRSSCGGNMVFIHHIVNGQTYTSGYFHLASVNVSVGDVVTANTVIGYVGGSSAEWWDSCSTGAHLHLQMAYGLYMQDYTAWSYYSSKSFDPRLVINLPAEGVWFSGRDTRY